MVGELTSSGFSRDAVKRYESDTVIVFRYEAVPVVGKQLMLVAEVRVTTQRSEHTDAPQVTFRREKIAVERTETADKDKTDLGSTF